MADFSMYLTKMSLSYQGTEEEKRAAEILFSDTDIHLGDKRLNNVAAYTYNSTSCQKIFVMLEKCLSPTDNPWKTIYKSLLLLHTIVLYGSELAIDKAIGLCRFVHPLGTYNSALARKGFFSSGGTDYGAPVRAAAKTLDSILVNDEGIRKARSDARAGQDSLVPVGELLGLDEVTASHNRDFNPAAGTSMNYGQGINTSVGAGFGLHHVPGIYEGRPERYFDNDSNRKQLLIPKSAVQDSQHTRDAQAPSLLDMVFDDVGTHASALPPAEYLPALERQRELEAQLLAQQEQLKQLHDLQKQQQRLQELQQQQQQQQQQFPFTNTAMPQSVHSSNSSLSSMGMQGAMQGGNMGMQGGNMGMQGYPQQQYGHTSAGPVFGHGPPAHAQPPHMGGMGGPSMGGPGMGGPSMGGPGMGGSGMRGPGMGGPGMGGPGMGGSGMGGPGMDGLKMGGPGMGGPGMGGPGMGGPNMGGPGMGGMSGPGMGAALPGQHQQMQGQAGGGMPVGQQGQGYGMRPIGGQPPIPTGMGGMQQSMGGLYGTPGAGIPLSQYGGGPSHVSPPSQQQYEQQQSYQAASAQPQGMYGSAPGSYTQQGQPQQYGSSPQYSMSNSGMPPPVPVSSPAGSTDLLSLDSSSTVSAMSRDMSLSRAPPPVPSSMPTGPPPPIPSMPPPPL